MANEQSLPPAYDLIVYGASGFTGRLLVEHLLGTYGARGDIRWALEPFSDRSKITGPGVTLGAQQAQTFALAIHELATNAAKHGALSNPWGELLVSWKLANNGEAGGLNFDWLEIGGPTTNS